MTRSRHRYAAGLRLPSTKRKSAAPQSVAPEVVETALGLRRELDGALDVAARLLRAHAADSLTPEQRAEALDTARRLAVEVRLCFLHGELIVAQVIERLLPFPAMRAALRVAYTLVALSGEQPEEMAMLDAGELAGLLEAEGALDWMEYHRDLESEVPG